MDATPDRVGDAGRASTSSMVPWAPAQGAEIHDVGIAAVPVQFAPEQADRDVAGSPAKNEIGAPTGGDDAVTGPVLAAVARVDRLAAAWEVVRSNDASDGVYRDSTRRFAEQLTGNLCAASTEPAPPRNRRWSPPNSR